MKTPKKQNIYWTVDTDAAIELYNATQDERERNQIFNEWILIPLERMAEAIYSVHGKGKHYHELDDNVLDDMVTHGARNLHLYQPGRSGFTYFNVALTNYLWGKNKSASQKAAIMTSVEGLTQEGWEPDQNPITETPFVEQSQMDEDYVSFVKQYWEQNFDKHYRPKERYYNFSKVLVKSFLDDEWSTPGLKNGKNAFLGWVRDKYAELYPEKPLPPYYSGSKHFNIFRNVNSNLHDLYYRGDGFKLDEHGRIPMVDGSEKYYTRQCGICNATVSYKTYYTYKQSLKQPVACRSCNYKIWQKDLVVEDKTKLYERTCPHCHRPVYYRQKANMKRAERLGWHCNQCKRELVPKRKVKLTPEMYKERGVITCDHVNRIYQRQCTQCSGVINYNGFQSMMSAARQKTTCYTCYGKRRTEMFVNREKVLS